MGTEPTSQDQVPVPMDMAPITVQAPVAPQLTGRTPLMIEEGSFVVEDYFAEEVFFDQLHVGTVTLVHSSLVTVESLTAAVLV
jgi:hypothetical protein